MNKRFFYYVNTAVLFLLVMVNLLIYLNRNDGYAYKEYAGYAQLYETSESQRILSFANTDKGLELVLLKKGKQPNWLIKSETGNASCNSDNPVIKLSEGIHSYTISSKSTTLSPVELVINLTKKNSYEKSQRKRDAVIELLSSNIPVGEIKTRSLEEWQRESEYSLPEEQKLLKDWLTENAGLLPGNSTIRKVEKIALAVLKKLDKHRGIPDDSMDCISPYQQFKRTLDGRSELWCGNFTSILAAFLKTEGIVSREVCPEGKLNSVFTSGHSLNEVFIPELNKWVMVDLTSKAIFISAKGKYLNLLELYSLHASNDSNIEVKTMRNDSLITANYTEIKPFYTPYLSMSPRLVYYLKEQFQNNTYSFWNRWSRYFLKRPTFVTYSGTVEIGNEKFYIKQLAALLLLFFTFYLVLLRISGKLAKKRNKTFY